MQMTKKRKIMAIKILAQIVSTWHMFDAQSHSSAIAIAIVGALALGTGEYVISNEYATIKNNPKTKKILLRSLVGLSLISLLANIESTMRFIDWTNQTILSGVYSAFSGFIYAIAWPTIIVTTSFIKLDEAPVGAPVVKIEPEKEKELKGAPEEKQEKILQITSARRPYARRGRRSNIDPEGRLSPEVMDHIMSLSGNN